MGYKAHVNSLQRNKIVENHWIRPITSIQSDMNKNFGIYTYWRTLNKSTSDKVKNAQNINKRQIKDLNNWKNYQIFVCILSAISNNQIEILQLMYNEHDKVFTNFRTKISKRSILHIAAFMNKDREILNQVLKKFRKIDSLLHVGDVSNRNPSKLAKEIGEKSNCQVLLYHDWKRRTNTVV